MNTGQMIRKYIELRSRRAALKKQYEEEDLQLKALMEKMEQWFHSQLVSDGETCKRTPVGSVFITHKDYASIADWDVVKKYIAENNAWGLVNRRVNVSAVKEIMSPDANGLFRNPPPPGVNFTRVETVGIRQS